MATVVITRSSEFIQAAIGPRHAPVIKQIACEGEWFGHLVTGYGKLYGARSTDSTGKRATSTERRIYLKIASEGSPVLLQWIQ